MPLNVSTPFTPFASTIGGMLIGWSAVLVMATLGRIAGISGITAGAVPSGRRDWGWRLAFVCGLVSAPLVATALTGVRVGQTVSSNLPAMALAGLLVGSGTVLGSGCTSGHGICGLARLSPRSLVAVIVFMTAGFATVFVLRHLA